MKEIGVAQLICNISKSFLDIFTVQSGFGSLVCNYVLSKMGELRHFVFVGISKADVNLEALSSYHLV
jgi:hypothetical protein